MKYIAASSFEDNPYAKPFKIEARDIILHNFLQTNLFQE